MAVTRTLVVDTPSAEARSLPVSWYLQAVLFGSSSIVLGAMWDISWVLTGVFDAPVI